MRGAFTIGVSQNLRLGPLNAAMRRGAERGLALAAEHVLTVANTMVPLEEGTLLRSGQTRVIAEDLVAAVYYDTPYAVRQHEDMTLRHENGRRSKWLEAALTQERDAVRKLIVDCIRAELNA